MRHRPRLDSNHNEIADTLRLVGASVQSLASVGSGCPDLLVGFRGANYLLEVKDGSLPPSRKGLTPDEVEWHGDWNGQADVIETVNEALGAIGAIK